MKPPSFDRNPPAPAIEKKKSLAEEFTKEEIIQGLSIPDKGIVVGENVEIQSASKRDMRSPMAKSLFGDNVLKIEIFLFKKENDTLKPFSDMTFFLGEQINGEKIFFGNTLLLEKRDEGSGLDLECQREFFCKNHGIQTIYNRATSGSGYVGAYVWAKYGYEFADEKERDSLAKDLSKFASNQGVKITQDLSDLKRPIDFARVESQILEKSRFFKKIKKIATGKKFLLNEGFLNDEIAWHGKRDLTPGSQGTKDFIAYLREKGREDLIQKYYADEK